MTPEQAKRFKKEFWDDYYTTVSNGIFEQFRREPDNLLELHLRLGAYESINTELQSFINNEKIKESTQ